VKPGLHTFTRRQLLGMGVAAAGASFVSGCKAFNGVDQPTNTGTLLTDPTILTRVSAPKGTATKGLTVPYNIGEQSALLYVPAGYQASTPVPLVLMLHGEGQAAISALDLFEPYADAAGLALLAVDSNNTTWDILATGFYGPDVQFINASLAAAFNEVNVDPTRVTVEGFSDGASYALATGLTNGALFSKVISFSAGYIAPYDPSGNKPSFFMSQGTSDTTFDITQSGDFIDSKLVAAGYTVDYVRFDGVHEIPDQIVQQAITWLTTT
jgi:phospholipase/carboxylesterase